MQRCAKSQYAQSQECSMSGIRDNENQANRLLISNLKLLNIIIQTECVRLVILG